MAFITDILNTIKNAHKGKDMRQAIYDGIQQCYEDATGHPDSVAAAVKKIGEVSANLSKETADRKAEVNTERKRIDNLIKELPATAGEYQQSKLVLHSYDNAAVKCTTTSGNYTNVPAFTTDQGGPLSSLYTKKSNYQIAVNKSGLYLFELRIHVNSLIANKRVELAPFVNDTRIAALASSYNTAGNFTLTQVAALPLWLSANDTVDFRIAPIEAVEVSLQLGDVLVYAIDWEDKFKIPDYTGYAAETKDIRTGADGTVYGTAGEAVRKQIGNITEDIGNLNKEKLDSDVVYEVGDDGEIVSSTKMMDISGNGEIAKISADSVYKDNIIPLPNIAEKTVNGLTYSAKDGIISLNGTATTYTLIDLGVNLSMMDGLSAIGYKIFILDGTLPSGASIILGLSFGGYAQTLTNTVQEKKSSSLITFNNKNISISINNNTAINVKFGVVVIPINDIPSKFNVGKKYAGYMLNQLICTNNMWAFGTNISKIKLAQYYRFRKNKLYGKSLFVAGDSVAFGFGSGGKSYADIIAEKNKMSMKKVAVSGTTIAKRDGMANSILEQVQMMDKLYDYVLIEGGFNDYFQKDKGVSIGTMPKNMNSRRDDKTTYGALDSICLWLKQNYPASKILFVVPHKIMTITGVIDSEFYPYLQAIRDVCEKYSISYADIALKGGCTSFYQEFRDTYFSGDGIHPNLEGYETFYVPRIEAEMEML